MIEIFIIAGFIYVLVVLPLIFKKEILNYFFGQSGDIPRAVSRPEPEDIIVKSKTVSGQTYTPLDNATPKEKPIENEPNLAPEIKKTASAAIPMEELDEAFSSDDKLDIDVAMEVDDDTLDEDVEAEELVKLTGGLASGVSVEQMSMVVKTLSKSAPTEIEQEQTAAVIEKVHTTEMMQQIISSIPDGDLKVKQILTACEQRFEKVRPKPKTAKGNKLPDDFRLEDYIN